MDQSETLQYEKPHPEWFAGHDDTLLGIQKPHLPEAFRKHFLDDDIILFTRRTYPSQDDIDKAFEKRRDRQKRIIETHKNEDSKYPSSSPESRSNKRPPFCASCVLDRISLWTLIVVSVLAISGPLFGWSTCILSSTGTVNVTNICVGRICIFLLTTLVQGLAVLWIRVSYLIESRPNKRKHRHIIEPLVARYLPAWCYDALHDEFLVKLDGYKRLWDWLFHMKSKYEGHPQLSMWLMALKAGGMLDDMGVLVVRMGRYPVPASVAWLARVATPGFVRNSRAVAWLDNVYQTFYLYRREEEAFEAYHELEMKGLLREDAAPLPPVKYSIAELEKESGSFLTFLPISSVTWERNYP